MQAFISDLPAACSVWKNGEGKSCRCARKPFPLFWLFTRGDHTLTQDHSFFAPSHWPLTGSQRIKNLKFIWGNVTIRTTTLTFSTTPTYSLPVEEQENTSGPTEEPFLGTRWLMGMRRSQRIPLWGTIRSTSLCSRWSAFIYKTTKSCMPNLASFGITKPDKMGTFPEISYM